VIDSSVATVDGMWIRCLTSVYDQHEIDTFDYIELIHFCNLLCVDVLVSSCACFIVIGKRNLSIAKWILYDWLYSTD
jgi:hypothetical protein